MNDGMARCRHGFPATEMPVTDQAMRAQGYTHAVARECPTCDGVPCSIPRIIHARPSPREVADDKEGSSLRRLLLITTMMRLPA